MNKSRLTRLVELPREYSYEKSAIVSETNAKMLEKNTNEFRRIKGELQSEKERLEKSLPKLE